LPPRSGSRSPLCLATLQIGVCPPQKKSTEKVFLASHGRGFADWPARQTSPSLGAGRDAPRLVRSPQTRATMNRSRAIVCLAKRRRTGRVGDRGDPSPPRALSPASAWRIGRGRAGPRRGSRGDRHAERNCGACLLPGRERVAGVILAMQSRGMGTCTIRIHIRWEDDIAVVSPGPGEGRSPSIVSVKTKPMKILKHQMSGFK
jgi:hypothetical protein